AALVRRLLEERQLPARLRPLDARLHDRAIAVRERVERRLRLPAVAREPLGRGLVRLLAARDRLTSLGVLLREGDLERPETRRERKDRVGRAHVALAIDAVEAVAEPVELLLQAHHAEEALLVARSSRVELGAKRGGAGGCARGDGL